MNEDNHTIYFDPVYSEDVLGTSSEYIYLEYRIQKQRYIFKAKHVDNQSKFITNFSNTAMLG